MAAATEPRGGMKHGWSLGESGWNVGMDENLLRISRFGFHLSVLDRDLTSPPGSPAAGDAYIVAASATGAWATHDDEVAVWDGDAWVFGEPRVGWLAYVEDEGKLCAYINTTSVAWSSGVNLNP